MNRIILDEPTPENTGSVFSSRPALKYVVEVVVLVAIWWINSQEHHIHVDTQNQLMSGIMCFLMLYYYWAAPTYYTDVLMRKWFGRISLFYAFVALIILILIRTDLWKTQLSAPFPMVMTCYMIGFLTLLIRGVMIEIRYGSINLSQLALQIANWASLTTWALINLVR